MRNLLVMTLVFAACGGGGGGTGDDGGGDDIGGGSCLGEVDSVSDVEDASVLVTGEFDGPPIMVLELGDQRFEVDCDQVNLNNATCDVTDITAGTYNLSFGVSCDDGSTSIAMIGADVPDTIDIP
jgi:hypothetical protein